MNNNFYESPYGFKVRPEAAYTPEEEKELYDKILKEIYKNYTRNRIMEILKISKYTHYNLLYNEALKQYKSEMNTDAEAEWQQNKQRLYEIWQNAKADKDKIAAIKELNHMAEFSQINKKVDGQEDNKFTISFNI